MKSRDDLLYSPIMHTLIGLALGFAGMLAAEREPALAVFAVTVVYALASPILIAFRRWWFVNAVLSTVGMVVLLLVMPMLGSMLIERNVLTDTGLILILPMMVFPCALVLSGVLRLLIVRKERGAASRAAA